MGQLIRILLILAAVWLVLFYVRRAFSRRNKPPVPTAPARMVACAVCGTHVPESEAVHAGGKVYCGEAHRKTAEKA